MTYLLDTNVVSEWTKPRPDRAVIDWLRTADERETFLSTISIGELRRGILLMDDGKHRRLLLSWLDDDLFTRFEGRLLPIDLPTAEAWAGLMADGQQRGRSIDAMDAFIGATALANDLTLVTRNTRHFEWSTIPLLNPWTNA